ncbi:MAG: hypothetical protein SFT94_05085 [Pseudanabaenaceae cyanobacterium bins.68]|nr:hypothetical protein [Pseudanabaenaceae cyanobacterium bins.68]
MVERPIKKADRIAPVEGAVSSDSPAVVEPTPTRKTVAPVLAKDRSNSPEPKPKSIPNPDSSHQTHSSEEPRAKERGRDRQKRGGDDTRQTINQALARGPRPIKAKVEELVAEVEPTESVAEEEQIEA